MLIWLTHANHLYSDRKQIRKMQPYPPLQTLIVAAVLREAGHNVAFFDCTFDRDFIAHLDRAQPDLVAVVEDNFNFLTKMCLLQNRELAFEIAQEARRRGIPSLVNSSDATGDSELYFRAGFDRVVRGETEAAIVQLCSAWAVSAPLGPTQHSMFVNAATQHSALAALDKLPMPAWDLVEFATYRNAWIQAHGYFSLNLVTSRGCPYRCNWCAKPIHGNTYRSQSPKRAADELRLLRDMASPDHIWYADDIFGLSGGASGRWANDFAAEIETYNLQVPFKMQTRCDLMTPATAASLARAGCTEVWMGAESGSQKILDAMEKGISVHQIGDARERLRERGIRCGLFLQFGYPGEEWEDIEQTIQMIRRVQPDDIGISVSYPLPGTRFHQIVSQKNSEHSRWRDSGDLALIASAPFPPDFYRALSDALHSEVRNAETELVRDAWDKVEQMRCACC